MNIIYVNALGVKSHKVRNASLLVGSHYAIKGTVKKKGVALPCIVRLYDRISGVMATSVWSDAQGNYAFYNLRAGVFYSVVAVDPKSQYNAVIKDRILSKEFI